MEAGIRNEGKLNSSVEEGREEVREGGGQTEWRRGGRERVRERRKQAVWRWEGNQNGRGGGES